MSFKDKVVIVTGSSAGIGASIAISFAKEGADVVVIGRNEEKLKNVAKSCEGAGKAPLVIKAELCQDSDVKRIIKETIDKYGKIDVLINNAGIVRSAELVDEGCLSVYDEIFNINVRPVLHLMHLASSYLIKSKGNIINISSVAGINSMIASKVMAYGASKAALNHLTNCVAAELGKHGVRVNTISPGPVITDIIMGGGLSREEAAKIWELTRTTTILKRTSETKEIADMCLYLAGDKGVGITGANVVIDNGMLLYRGETPLVLDL